MLAPLRARWRWLRAPCVQTRVFAAPLAAQRLRMAPLVARAAPSRGSVESGACALLLRPRVHIHVRAQLLAARSRGSRWARSWPRREAGP